jgi:hypothetical protein
MVTVQVMAATATASNMDATMSLGRCHLRASVARPVDPTAASPVTTMSHR